jgi:hypothetical protein
MILILTLVLCGFWSSALSAPFLISDPQPKWSETTGSGTESYEYSIDGEVTWITTGSSAVGIDQIRLSLDLEPLPNSATVHIRAKNIWGVSTSVPFALTKQPPSGLSGYQVSPNP